MTGIMKASTKICNVKHTYVESGSSVAKIKWKNGGKVYGEYIILDRPQLFCFARYHSRY